MIWSGVYQTFQSIPSSGENHTSREWLERSLTRLSAVQSGSLTQPFEVFSSNPFLPVPAILSVLQSGDRPRVVDYGGNLGQLGIWLKALCGLETLEWTVVERKDFLNNPFIQSSLPDGINFVESINEVGSGYNVLHFGSSLQYVDSLEDEFEEHLQANPPTWISIADFMGGESIQTFSTKQKYFAGFLKSKFRNLSETVEFFERLGFGMISKTGSLNESNLRYFPELNLPPECRIQYPLDLVFRHKAELPGR